LPEKEKYLREHLQCPAMPEVKGQYDNLILINHDVFAKDKYDLGLSDAISHKIHKKDIWPIFVKQFWTHIKT